MSCPGKGHPSGVLRQQEQEELCTWACTLPPRRDREHFGYAHPRPGKGDQFFPVSPGVLRKVDIGGTSPLPPQGLPSFRFFPPPLPLRSWLAMCVPKKVA